MVLKHVKGASGSGKSTIVGLLERWYDVDAGRITLDGNNIEELNLRWLRTNIRLVQQEPVLFDSTVYENIANGLVGTPWENESASDKRRRVQLAAQTAFAHDFVCELPDGYDTRIGERGGLLSGGQKQRIAIARSIISQPKILLLDEATSALDPQSEAIVQKALDEASKDRTTIVIAHKLKTIRNADNIVVMKQGRIIEIGQHDELVARDGAYAKLVQVQDLSIQGKIADQTEEEEDPDDVRSEKLAKRQSMRKRSTVHEPDLEALIDSHDFATASQTSLIHTIFKLATLTPEIKMWFMIVTVCVVLGGMVS
jgi:ATP-binding cassette, subfamily B (MDR/TAP), member 1